MLFNTLKDMMRCEYLVVERPGLEGDDVLGILATSRPVFKNFGGVGEPVIVSIDKDMKTIPGMRYGSDGFFRVSKSEADHHHLFQTLTRDATDGYRPSAPSRGLDFEVRQVARRRPGLGRQRVRGWIKGRNVDSGGAGSIVAPRLAPLGAGLFHYLKFDRCTL